MKTALVTGGASGLGLGLVELLSKRGYAVALLDLDDDAGQTAAKAFGAWYYHVDVSDHTAMQSTVSKVVADLGTPERVFLNAGVMSRPQSAPIDDDPLDWLLQSCERVVNVNMYGPLYGLHALAPLLAKAGGGDVVVTSSVAGISPLAFDPYYAMSKHALIGMVRSFAPVLEPQRIRLNAFCPGLMRTQIVPDALKHMDNGMSGLQAAETCYDISATQSSGKIWVREGFRQTLKEYVMPELDI
ncbi:MAG: SDR family NAD(P)-dependent oxidoreductase [Pseudomonadales bacterium]